ncbi:MAG: hypothetical protein J6P82_06100 [Bacteroidales bacterium]|jgi:hypothetical protein|nr:hypothetical protein [Bacteroidales bacterium]MBP5213176.1 hypothetical protein [Bacteroidales bacterium]MBP5765240.1 hypothetical protein [Bacteroidales bacterium]
MADMENSVYDDAEAVKFIKERIPQEVKGKYEDDDIVYMTDLMVEYYERNGWLDADADEEIDIDIEDIVNYVSNACKKDKECHFDTDPESIRWIIEAELDYEESLA